ncbi:hypothetical protein DDE20_07215 [Pararhodobacter oceanensis]|uniref:Uncharacterized protein n=1 Tax=Pararhodobacter oceanensis TaxID=2172121 RepID=A0A2T8HWR8_9RHOB|nr:hypothetical protein DDE20_07215 [Pararhodobacter oceanensis]
MRENEHPELWDSPATGACREQETSMSKITIAALTAVFGLSVLAGCNQSRQEEFVMVEPAPQPIYVEPVSSKYN